MELSSVHLGRRALSETERRLQAANLPYELWAPQGACTRIPDASVKKVSLAAHDYVQHLAVHLQEGVGISLSGPRKSGKTYWLGRVTRSVLNAFPGVAVTEEFSEVVRLDYQALFDARAGEPPLKMLAEAAFVFLDNTFGQAPTPRILAALSRRRDRRLPLLLAFLGSSAAELQNVGEIDAIFSDTNTHLVLSHSILPYLTD